MMTRHKIPRAEMSHSTITLSIPTVIALILVPLIVAAGLIGTTWKMTDRLGQVKAAIVNNDDGVKVNGQQVPLGRQLSGGLIDSKSQTADGRTISWELSDSKKAADGLKDGSYAAVVTIPDSFSRNAMSFSANKGDLVKKATVDVKTSDSSPVTDTTIATMTAQAAERSINKTLGSQYLDNIYVGFNKSANSMVSLSKGASQLDTGAAGLSNGVKQSTNGAKQLSGGMNQLASGGQQLATQGDQMVTGVKQLATGIGALDTNGQKLASGGEQLGSNGKKLSSGVSQLSSGLNQLDKQLQNAGSGSSSGSPGVGVDPDQLAQLEKLKTGAAGVAQGTAGVHSGLKQYQNGMENMSDSDVNKIVQGVCQQNSQACATPGSEQLIAAGVKAGTTAAGQGLGSDDNQKSVIGGAKATNDGAQAYSKGVGTAIDQLVATLKNLPQQIQKEMAKQMKPLQDGVHQMATNTSKLSSGVTQYTNGVSQYASGVSQYTNGVSQLSKQMPQLTSGISQYVAGVGQYADGVSQSADGVEQYYDGQVKLSQGASQYAKGVHTYATQLAKGSKQVPTYSAADREKLSDAVTTPVNTDTNPMGTSAWVVGLIVILGLWIGALATWMAARTIPSRVLTSSRSSLQLLWNSMSTGAVVTAISALGLAVIASLATDISAGRAVGLFLMLLLVGAMCLAVNHALAAWLHSTGRFIALAFFVVAAAVGLVSAVPAPVRWVHDISPLKPAMEGVTAILSGSNPSFGSLLMIILWLVIGGVASLLAVNRSRHTTASKVLAGVA